MFLLNTSSTALTSRAAEILESKAASAGHSSVWWRPLLLLNLGLSAPRHLYFTLGVKAQRVMGRHPEFTTLTCEDCLITFMASAGKKGLCYTRPMAIL